MKAVTFVRGMGSQIWFQAQGNGNLGIIVDAHCTSCDAWRERNLERRAGRPAK